MKAAKYFDWKNQISLTDKDGCAFSVWGQVDNTASFTRMGENIFIFLDRGRLAAYDKYQTGIFDLELDVESAFHKMRLETTLTLLESYQRSGKPFARLLDVGCGSGQFLQEVSRRFPDPEYTGLDISLTALQRAAERIPGAEFVLVDAENAPFQPEYFDAVILNNILEHVPSPILLLSALNRILAVGGCMVISTPSRYRFDNLIRTITGKPAVFMSADHVTEYSVGQLIELLRYCGFDVQCVLGSKKKPARWTARNIVSYYLLKPILHTWLRMVGSKHVLDSTAFYLVKKTGTPHA